MSLILMAVSAFGLRAEDRISTKQFPVAFPEQQIEISVEIAANQAEREHGLMYRTSLGEKQGMLFLYPDQALREVWMKNTLLPLDIIFLAADGRIVSLLNNLQPCRQDPCPIYDSNLPAMYMLEVNAEFIEKYQLKIGQLLVLPALESKSLTDK